MKPATGPSDLERWQAQPGDVLLVTDIQNDFLPGGSLAVAGSDEVVPVLNRYIEEFVARGLPVYATRDWHPERHCSFRAQGGPWPVHCVAGTHGNEFAANLVLPPDTAVISKATAPDREAYSGCAAPTARRRACRRRARAMSLAFPAPRRCWRGSGSAPVDGFGIGTRLDTSSDMPFLDCAYKLQEYAGRARRKRSEGKATWPGRKQVFRRLDNEGRMAGDIVTLETDPQPGVPLLLRVMRGGNPMAPAPSLAEVRRRAADNLAQLPEPLRRWRNSVTGWRSLQRCIGSLPMSAQHNACRSI